MANQGHWSWAIESYVAGQAFDDAAGAIEIIAQDYYDGGQGAQIKAWIDSLPPTVLQEHPRLMLFRAKECTDTGAYDEAERVLEPAYRIYKERASDNGAARVLVQWAVVQRLQERYPRRRRQVQHGPQPHYRKRRAHVVVQAHQNLGICYQTSGRSGTRPTGNAPRTGVGRVTRRHTQRRVYRP